MIMMSALYAYFCSASSLKQQSTGSHVATHGVIKLQPRFKVCNISYPLLVLFHSSSVAVTYILVYKPLKDQSWTR
jgi:hypothetical protein